MLVKTHLFLLYLLFSTSTCLANDEIPAFFEANYTLYSNDTQVGMMERRFYQLENGQYSFRSESKTTGFIALIKKVHILEESTWDIIDSYFTPLNYTYHHIKGKKERNAEINFNWDKQQITNRVNESTWHMQTQKGIQDKLLYQLTIMSDLMTGQVPESYAIADGGKIKQYSFKRIADETVSTPLGDFKTIKLSLHKKNKKQENFLWCAYDLNFLPIKVTSTEKDDRLSTAIIKSIKGLGKKNNES
ncbi:MAG: DUF3108 domain-containing protein [Proteobacteria bacterium]|nr:DUF3108 domain-containing protein [Pseudomonadota bacterium]NOG59204.1 DUF3108 domain-containing protein [Pseudomonadota bacterium]